MKVRIGFPHAVALIRAGIAVAVVATALSSAPAQAGAITREKILERSKSWIARKIPYSQHSYYRGYRRDCSGFVSMSWALGRSYTSRTIVSRATRIPISRLQPGDAVRVPGHVSIFGGWKNKRARTYYALEQTTWGSHARRRVRAVRGNAIGLRRKGITQAASRASAAGSNGSLERVAVTEIRAASNRRTKSLDELGEFSSIALALDER